MLSRLAPQAKASVAAASALATLWRPGIGTIASASPSGVTSVKCMPSSAKRRRSEEHTSALQSLLRISYAVFCLKHQKKHKQGNPQLTPTTQQPKPHQQGQKHTTPHNSLPHTTHNCTQPK